MAINQANILVGLEGLVNPIDKKEFIYGFLTAYGYSKATITRLRSSDGRNLAANPNAGEIAFKKGIYFKPVEPGHNIHEIVDHLRVSADVAKNNIRFVIATDWIDFVAYDLKADERLECLLTTLPENYTFFLPLAGFEKATIYSENPADVKAAEQMGRLFDLIKEKNQPKTPEEVHALNVFLTRLLFCFFAEDTGIFEKSQMSSAVASYTSEDGSDVASFFKELFEVLNEKNDSSVRKSKPAYLKNFPYVNGGLFKSNVEIPEFGAKARRVLLDCSTLKWSEINPDIFGSMFQSVIDEAQRGSLGQHYTSVTNIMKVIQPLFLDKLEAALEDSRKNEVKLKTLLDRISKIKIFDPACGSGNFLIIAYKELRKIEMAVFKALNKVSKQDVIFMSNIKLSQFYGIEIDDFPYEIALLSLWLTEHQMNQAFKSEFGYAPPSLPLRDSGNIACDNSLRLAWEEFCPNSASEVYICGNPPFLGSKNRSDEQNNDMDAVFSDFDKHRYLDLVACWFWKGAKYIEGTNSELALVATNSLCQGEQVALLWPKISGRNVSMHIAYQSFPWKNNAKNNAGVHVVIIGLSSIAKKKYIFSNQKDIFLSKEVSQISPYLLEGNNSFVVSRAKPLCSVSPMVYGNKPVDGGHLILDKSEHDALIKIEPNSKKWIRKLYGADDFLNGKERYCLWLLEATSDEINSMPEVLRRVEQVKLMRLGSLKAATRKLSETPHLFGEIRQQRGGHYILIPRVSSERRTYMPTAFLDSEVISTDGNQTIPNGTLYDFGIINSSMHLDWMRTVCGRLESRFNYSATIVYNTFPWPKASSEQKKVIEILSEKVLLIRECYPEKTLAQLYDPDLMPVELLQSHKNLDAAVERLYRDKAFKDSSERLEHLFKLYEKLNSNSSSNQLNGELW